MISTCEGTGTGQPSGTGANQYYFIEMASREKGDVKDVPSVYDDSNLAPQQEARNDMKLKPVNTYEIEIRRGGGMELNGERWENNGAHIINLREALILRHRNIAEEERMQETLVEVNAEQQMPILDTLVSLGTEAVWRLFDSIDTLEEDVERAEIQQCASDPMGYLGERNKRDFKERGRDWRKVLESVKLVAVSSLVGLKELGPYSWNDLHGPWLRLL
ncbi:hypothetical protein Scep_017288 [Stephania cephalantha]|uniref:Uncharacterized protein n=1 Tax=Stephania cephalantha TaxID=152367 RepID=A0AAP0IPS5_9MAGN